MFLMQPRPTAGKVFMQDKVKLLKLANTIASEKESDIRQKIDKSKGSASFIDVPSQQSAGNRPKTGGFTPSSERLRAAKNLLAARKSKQKREKARARKREEHQDPGPNGNSIMDSRKRVCFAD